MMSLVEANVLTAALAGFFPRKAYPYAFAEKRTVAGLLLRVEWPGLFILTKSEPAMLLSTARNSPAADRHRNLALKFQISLATITITITITNARQGTVLARSGGHGRAGVISR
jgi:hypothetical protein